MANITLDFLHSYETGERRESDPTYAYQYDEGHVLEAVLPAVVTAVELHYWIRGMEEAEAYTPTSITPNADGSCTILGNIPNKYFETNGELRVYIVVTDGDASITTYEGFTHICQRSMPDDYVDDDPENEATRVLIEAQEAAATATAAAETAKDVADSIPADYTQLSDDVSSLKEDITSIGTAYYRNTQDGLYHIRLALTQGVINSSGVENDTGAWLKTANYISVHTGDVYNYVGATKDANNISLSRYLIEYDATKTFIRRVGFPTNGYTVSSGVSYIRFCIGYGSSTGVTTPPDASYPDIAISSNYSPAKIKETVDTVEPFIYKHLYGASQPTITWNDGKTLGSDGNLANNADFITSDFLSASDVVNVEYDLASGETLPNMYVCRYADTDYTTLIGAREKLTSHSIFMYGAKYYRIAIKTSIGNASKISFNEFGSVPHKGKMYALGDSLTQGTWNNSGGSSGAQYARCYIQTVADLCGYDLVNLGDHGSGMLATGVDTGYALKGFIDNNTFTDADLITIAYGINDYIGNKAVGTVNDNVDADTCAGQLKYALSTLTGNGVEGSGSAPYARVVLILPQNGRRAYADSLSGSPTYATEWYMQLENNAGYTLADYRNMIKAVGEYYGVQVLDLNEISPINRGNLRNLLGDGLHPTKVGHVKIGQALASYF